MIVPFDLIDAGTSASTDATAPAGPDDVVVVDGGLEVELEDDEVDDELELLPHAPMTTAQTDASATR